jgi:hypothetical protein
MPSFVHEVLALLFPDVADRLREFLQRTVGLKLLDPFDEIIVSDPDATIALPVERRADRHLVLRKDGRAVHNFVVESQLRIDPKKRSSWVSYVTAAFLKGEVPTDLVVLTLSKRVARWAREPIALNRGGSVIRPLVIGPEEIPKILRAEEAEVQPELAVLSALVHGKGPEALQIAEVAFRATADLDELTRALYTEAIFAMAAKSNMQNLEKLMNSFRWPEGYEVKYPPLRDYAKALAERESRVAFESGKVLGLEKGLERGREEGREAGLEKGRCLEKARALRRVLEARGIPLSREDASRIEACTQLATLDRWFDRALSVSCAKDDFAD